MYKKIVSAVVLAVMFVSQAQAFVVTDKALTLPVVVGANLLADLFGTRDMAIPSSWATVDIDDHKFGVSPDGIVIFHNRNFSFLYDNVTGFALNKQGVRIADGTFKTFLDNLSKNPAAFTRFADNQKCSDYHEAYSEVDKQKAMPSVLPGSLPGSNSTSGKDERVCKSQYKNVIKIVTGICDNPGAFGPLADESTERGRIIVEVLTKYGLIQQDKMGKSLFGGSNTEGYAGMLRLLRTTIPNEIISRTKDLPPESEMITRKIFGDRWGKWSWEPGETIKSSDFLIYAGWLFFSSDLVAKQLTHLDYPLRRPDIYPDYKNTIISVSTSNYDNRGMLMKITTPLWKFQYMSLASKMPDLQTNGIWNIPADINKKSLWEKWSPFLASLTADELRELLLSASSLPYRTDSLALMRGYDLWNNPNYVEVYGKPIGSKVKLPIVPHNAAVLLQFALGTNEFMDLTSINCPSRWEGQGSRGLTLGHYLWFFMQAHGTDQKAVGWSVMRNVAAGKFDAARADLKSLSTELAKVKVIAEKQAKITLMSMDQDSLLNEISNNPTAVYKDIYKTVQSAQPHKAVVVEEIRKGGF